MADTLTNEDATASQRIVKHMNGDHPDTIERYLEHYHKISSWQAYGGRITNISLSELTMSCGSKVFKTQIDPPMSSLRDARQRLVAMDQDCVRALDRSDITIREYPRIAGWHKAWFVFCSTVFICFARNSNFAPKSLLSMILPDAFRRFCQFMQPFVIGIMLVAHTIEAYVFVRSRLQKHGVNARSVVFWQWVGDACIQGFVAFKRFDVLVAGKRAERARKKH